ncbi:SPRY domain-containing protein [Lederbergia citrisecunda]|uniref:SPRY domain-containing protein n=1 Tax=Lederbergia citrisecunda TaxID=2833583 RepID=UPI003D2A6647
MALVTWNPLDSSGTLSNSNLTTMLIGNTGSRATEGKTSGKWYWELSVVEYSNLLLGVGNKNASLGTGGLTDTSAIYFRNNSTLAGSASGSYGENFVNGDIIGVLLDLDEYEIEFLKNGARLGVAWRDFEGLGELFPMAKSAAGSGSRGVAANFGATPFKHPIPEGYYSYDGSQYGAKNKILILSDSTNYKTFDFETSSWEDFLISEESPSEQDFLTNGMNKKDIELIPESAWRELDGHSINILEYTDNPNQTESIVETETEPFTIYDEFGDTMEVLYYTDDLAKTEAELEITANYSPLDEFDEDFEVVTWTDETDAGRLLNMNALPQPQFVTLIDPHNIYGDFGGILPEEFQKGNKIGILRYLISPNGTNWNTWNGSSFAIVDTSSLENISNQGLSFEDINSITQTQWNTWQHDKLYVGVFIDEDIRGEAEAIVQSISYKSLVGKHTTKISDAKMYILNTKSTINVEFKGSTVVGSIDDEDKGKVQYRILLNEESFYPADGSFTPLLPSPLNISVTIPSDQIRIDENNTLRIEFQDYWGTTDYWERNFVGTYNGLLFLDESGEYYSTNIGDILKYLDFGVIIAGQTTLEHKVRIRNTYGFPVKNVYIQANQQNFPSGLKAQFGTNGTSFEALDNLPIEKVLEDGDEIDFYIRLSSQLGTQPVTNGKFDIIVTADQAVEEEVGT